VNDELSANTGSMIDQGKDGYSEVHEYDVRIAAFGQSRSWKRN